MSIRQGDNHESFFTTTEPDLIAEEINRYINSYGADVARWVLGLNVYVFSKQNKAGIINPPKMKKGKRKKKYNLKRK
jgi:hypothetical protein